jgi:AcrR family transcriptional regulator
MNERSFIVRFPMSKKITEPQLDRRQQILEAAMICFGECGFHQTSMHDISEKAGISVGLIYRYFKNKDEVIAALAAEHKRNIAELLERANQAPTLLEAMEILFTSDCCKRSPQIISAFVVDLFAEASRNPRVAKVVRDVTRAKSAGVAALIARSPEAKTATHGLKPAEIAEMIFAVNDGTMMRAVLRPSSTSTARQREQQLNVARTLWRLLFTQKKSHANGHR